MPRLIFLTFLLGIAVATNISNDDTPVPKNQGNDLSQLLTLLSNHLTQVKNEIRELKHNDNSGSNKLNELQTEIHALSSQVHQNLTACNESLARLNASAENITQKVETQRTQTTTQLTGIRNDVTAAKSSIQGLTNSLSSLRGTAVTDIKLGPRQFNPIHRNNGYHDAYPWIITEVSNWNKDEFADWVGRRQLLKKVDGSWRGMPAENS